MRLYRDTIVNAIFSSSFSDKFKNEPGQNIHEVLFKLVDTRSEEMCLLRGLRYANVSLTHSLTQSGVDTARN